MVVPAYPHRLNMEEQGRLLARVYAFILSDKFTGTYKEHEIERTDRSINPCQSQLAEIKHVVDAQEYNFQEAAE